MKKLVSILLFLLLFTVNASAFSVDKITPDSSFYLYSSDPQRVAEILNTDITALDNDIKTKKIQFLAVNSDKSKQIQLTVDETNFSAAVGNLSAMSDSSIKSLLPSITGLDNIKGRIVIKNNQKYVNINLKSEEYILTQFFTVEDNKLYTLSFYTSPNESTDYINTAFPTNTSVIDETPLKEIPKSFKIAVIVGTIIFGLAFLIILITTIREFVSKKSA